MQTHAADRRSAARTGASRAGPTRVYHTRPARLAALAPFAVFLFILFIPACKMHTQTFDSDAWKSQRGARAQDNRRGGMVPSLEASIRAGMPREDVIRLLGEPDSRDAETGTDVYELGVSEFGIDEEYYEIRYENGNVTSHRWARR